MWWCPDCKAPNEDDIQVCAKCGAPLFPAPPSESSFYLGSERHYLVPPVGEPLKLDMSQIVVFGRDASCNIRIASDTVSRRHAELRWRKDLSRIVLRDLNSQNGSYVNDVRVHDECVLADGAKLRLGDYVATYRRLAPGEPESVLTMGMSDTIVDADAVQSKAISGDAALFPLVDVLGRLAAHGASGWLEVDVGGVLGRLRLVNGHPSESTYAGLEGQPALRAIAALVKGHFRFEPVETGATDLSRSWADVLTPFPKASGAASILAASGTGAKPVISPLLEDTRIWQAPPLLGPRAAAAPQAWAAQPPSAQPARDTGPARPGDAPTQAVPGTDKRPTMKMPRPGAPAPGAPPATDRPGAATRKLLPPKADPPK